MNDTTVPTPGPTDAAATTAAGPAVRTDPSGRRGDFDTDTPTHRDLDRQAQTMRQTLQMLRATVLPAAVLQARRFVFTGCGSSYYAGLSAATLLSTLSSRTAIAVPSSELWLLPDTYLTDDCVVVGVSRTGTTTEVVQALAIAAHRGLPTVALTLAPSAPLLDLATVKIAMDHVAEEGRVMTQSFSNLLLAGQWIAAMIAEEDRRPAATQYLVGFGALVDALDELLPTLEQAGARIAARQDQHYVLLGSGPASAVCSEGVLKLQEMTQLPSESVTALEYRHGPIAALGSRTALILASTPVTAAYDRILASDALVLGYRPIVLTPHSVRDFPAGSELIELPASVPDWLWPNLYLALFQYLSWHRTMGLGRDPERVRNLDKTTTPVVDPHVVDLPAGPAGG